jgi:iron complex transport system substrate-binding protein
MRIASLLPSATEIVCAVGAREELVGISHECDFPDGVSALPVLTSARLGPLPSSRDIDLGIRGILESALVVYEIDVARLDALAPDVIVTQDLCDVCAVSIDDVRSAVARLARKNVEIVNLHPMRLGDLWSDIERVARALGREASGIEVAQRLRARVSGIAERSRVLSSRPKVLSVEWLAPVMIGGMWMPELIELGGGATLVTNAGEHAPTLSLAELAELDPDVVLVKPCGFSLSRTLSELPLLRECLPWGSWAAVREGRVFVADGNAYFNRSGPRLVESLEIMAACVHPAAFPEFRSTHRASVVRLGADLVPHAFDADLLTRGAREESVFMAAETPSKSDK